MDIFLELLPKIGIKIEVEKIRKRRKQRKLRVEREKNCKDDSTDRIRSA